MPAQLTRLFVTILSGCLLAGCAVQTGAPGVIPQGAYAHRVSSSDLDVYWNCTSPTPGMVEVEGIVHNTSGGDVRFVDLDLVGIGPKGMVSEARAAVAPVVLSLNETAPFSLQVGTTGPDTRLDLYYQYRPPGGRGAFAGDYHRSFARDICGPSHLTSR